MEPRFGSDFSNVRVHTGKHAAESARAIHAHAYTIGERIVFGAGQFSPESTTGQQLLAHELTHVVQQSRSGASDAVLRRKYDDHYTLDPESPSAWSLLRSKDLATEFWQRPFLATLSATPQAALDLEQHFGKAAPPSSEEERDQSVEQIRTLIRLNAVGMMASHRAGVARHRDELESPAGKTESGAAGASAVRSPSSQNTNAIRAAAGEASRLLQLKDVLEESERQLRLESTSQLRAGGGSFSDALEKIDEYSREYRGPWGRAYFARLAERLQGIDRLDRGTATALIFNMGQDLSGWRHKQVNGVTVALNHLYERFPFLAHMDPEDIVAAVTDTAVMERMREAFTDLLLHIDNATADMGSGEVDPFNLPQAVKFTKESLPAQWQTVLDQAIHRHQLFEFWLGMGLTALQMLLVFIPVVGPLLAASLGLAQLVSSTEEMLTRYEISQASTEVSGELMGVQGPSAFEWAMLGVQAALTVADLAGAWKEISAVRAHFPEAEPHLVKSEIDVVPEGEPGQVPREKVMTEGGSAADRPSLESSRNIEGPPTGKPLEHELEAVADSPSRPSTIPGYVEEVELENGHVWRRRADGRWCRFSDGGHCFTGDLKKPSSFRPETPEARSKGGAKAEELSGREKPAAPKEEPRTKAGTRGAAGTRAGRNYRIYPEEKLAQSQRGYQVYEYRNAKGELLYVGKSGGAGGKKPMNWTDRLKGEHIEKEWIGEARSVTVTFELGEQEALALEEVLIPEAKYNIKPGEHSVRFPEGGTSASAATASKAGKVARFTLDVLF
jgi:hypothetical protein